MGPRVASKIPSRSGQRDGIFDAAQGPVWYFYYLIVSILCENICKNTFSVRWHQKVALKILVLQIVPQGAGNVIDLPQKSPETKTWIFWCKTIWGTTFTKGIMSLMGESI